MIQNFQRVIDERQARYDKAVSIYEYNRQWLTHDDSVNASMYRTSVPRSILKRECQRVGVWDD